jgi:peptidoglycan/LPS O-acetylase OafA/YrhL
MFHNSNILEPLFWIIMGMLYTVFIMGLAALFRDINVKMNWWKWSLVLLWFILLSIIVAGGFTLIGEKEMRAGLLFMAVSGVVMIVVGLVLGRFLVRSGNEQKKN